MCNNANVIESQHYYNTRYSSHEYVFMISRSQHVVQKRHAVLKETLDDISNIDNQLHATITVY